MHIKSIGIFAAALALAALAILPAAAMATLPVTFRSKGAALKKGAEIKGFSTNFKLLGGSGMNVECAENEIVGALQENPGTGATTNVSVTSVRFQGASKAQLCLTNLPRYEVLVGPVKINGGGNITFFSQFGLGLGSLSPTFTLNVWDRAKSKAAPIAVCSYGGSMNIAYLFKTLLEGTGQAVVNGVALLLPGWIGACEESVEFAGSFTVTSSGASVSIDP